MSRLENKMIAHLDDMNERIVKKIALYDENGDMCHYSLENDSIEKMLYHSPCGEGDRHFVDVYTTNGECIREFNPIEIIFEKHSDYWDSIERG
jgi:hypothetical protein